MQWTLFATLSEAAGDSEIPVDSDPATLRDAFDNLVESNPDLATEVLDDDGELHEHVRVLVDGDDPFLEGDGWDTRLDSGAELALFPPVSGG